MSGPEGLHYKPPWYPNHDPQHNPWCIADNMTGKTYYAQWADGLPPGELLRLINEHHERERSKA